jgi:hypothetical protein
MNPIIQGSIGTALALLAAGAVALVKLWAKSEQTSKDVGELKESMQEMKQEKSTFAVEIGRKVDSLGKDMREWREQQIRFEERLATLIQRKPL